MGRNKKPERVTGVSAIANRLEAELSGDDHVVGVSLAGVVLLPDGFPPRCSLTQLAHTAAHPEDITSVRPIKPPSRWRSELRQILERAAHRDSLDLRSSMAVTADSAEDLVRAVEEQWGSVRMAADVVIDEASGCPAAWRKDFVLVTASHVAMLTVTIDD
ncbi:hypothetical protein AB0C81_14060 [Streptomyces roseoverticillatus]|uniref:hypothetical protein n=1 Tax=Streptomyces roseoverticillatus TaxID=66429 RepID=UPI0033C532DA